ncbi:MAG: phage tail tube protein [Clostridiales bacterium]|nr:phage tail tube protein [Clostridiales bacterium]
MAMEYNKSPISLREGHIYIDGVEVADGIKCNIKFTPDVWTGQQLGEQGYSSRWLGYKITGDITRRRSTNFLKEKIQEYKDSGITPEMTIQGVMDDAGSDYYQDYGTDTVTCVGCVLTGDLPLTVLDSGGEVVEDTISFNAKDIT